MRTWECCSSEVSRYSVNLQEVIQDLGRNDNYKKSFKHYTPPISTIVVFTEHFPHPLLIGLVWHF